MESHRYYYETEDYDGNPSAKDLDRRARDGWRLVSVLGRGDGATAYFEKVVTFIREQEPSHGPARAQLDSFHRHMVKMLQNHGNIPELQRIADGVETFHSELLTVLRERLGDQPELAEIADDEARLVEALLALRHVAQEKQDSEEGEEG